MSEFCVVFCTVPSDEEGSRIAREVVEKRLAACVNILPQVQSVYRWNDEIETSAESLLIMKTGLSLFPRLREAIEQLHTYETPEVIAIPIMDGSAKYLSWLNGQLNHS